MRLVEIGCGFKPVILYGELAVSECVLIESNWKAFYGANGIQHALNSRPDLKEKVHLLYKDASKPWQLPIGFTADEVFSGNVLGFGLEKKRLQSLSEQRRAERLASNRPLTGWNPLKPEDYIVVNAMFGEASRALPPGGILKVLENSSPAQMPPDTLRGLLRLANFVIDHESYRTGVHPYWEETVRPYGASLGELGTPEVPAYYDVCN